MAHDAAEGQPGQVADPAGQSHALAVLLDPATEESINKRFSQEGIPAYPSFVSAARALKKAAEYYTLKRYLDD